MQDEPGFIHQLMHRRVMRAVSMYMVSAFVLLQVGDVTFEPLGLPDWSMTALIVGLVVGLPIVALAAWVFDLTPSGLVRTRARDVERQPLSLARALEFALIAVMGLALTYFIVKETARETPMRAIDRSVVVLPFAHIGDEAAYLAAGLTTELTNILAAIPDLRVTSSGSAATIVLGDDQSTGEAFNVAHLVKGSVQAAAAEFRVNVQLIRAADGKVLWAQQTDRPASDIFSVQDEIARNVASSLQSTLYLESLRRNAQARTDNPDAYAAYLLALHYRANDWPSAIEHAQRAVRLDPEFVPAHLLLADVYARRVGGTLGAAQAHPAARRALQTVLELDPENPRALVIQGHLERFAGDYRAAEELYRRAKALAPNQPTRDLANLLYFLGRLDEALAEYRHTVQTHPLEPGFYQSALFASGDADAAIALQNSVFATGSERWRNIAYAQLAQWYAFLGERALANANADLALAKVEPNVHYARGMIAYALARTGREAEAFVIVEDLEARQKRQYVSPAAFVTAYLGLRDFDRMFIALDRSVEEHVYLILTQLKTSPLFDEVRGDLRFLNALERLGLSAEP